MGSFAGNFTVELKAPEENQVGNQLRDICATLFTEAQLCDVTISCKDGQLQAHRMILSSVSASLYKLFTSTSWPNPCSHPVILLRNSRVEDVRAAMEFIYTGGVSNIRKDKLQALMEVGRELECPSLIRAIETAVQNCGVAMFRKLVSSNSNSNVVAISPISRTHSGLTDSNHSSRPSSSLLANGNGVYKQESGQSGGTQLQSSQPRAHTHIQISEASDGRYTLSIPQPIQRKSSPAPRAMNLKMNGSNSTNIRIKNGTLLKTIGQKYPDMTVNSVHDNENDSIHQGQAETFVYTNEDVGLDCYEPDSSSFSMSVHGYQETRPKSEPVRTNGRAILNGSSSNGSSNGTLSPATMQYIRQLKRRTLPHAHAHGDHLRRKLSPYKVVTKTEDSDPASCPWCLQVFTNIPLLQRHIKTHVGIDKPKFVCEFCNTKFGRSAHLKRHLRTHTGEKPYECSICQTKFARQDKLKIHLERHLQNGNNSLGLNENGVGSSSQEMETFSEHSGHSSGVSPNGNGVSLIGSNGNGINEDPYSSLPIKVLIPMQMPTQSSDSSATSASGEPQPPRCFNEDGTTGNGNGQLLNPNSNPAHVINIRNESLMLSPPRIPTSLLYESVAKNLSPSTTITTVTSASANARLG